uniref:Bifunctional (P)ppGpp synthetase/guanosine-3',5'-bis(Diphosphate) 3'-pyrophosphohydrolase n=1 Tax=candidate division CPR3 bacterium TaxID=2268181 RepID=A0A7C4M157_UNCC3
MDLKSFFSTSQKKFDEKDVSIIQKAFDIAQKSHEGEKRKSGEPYFNHTYKTALNLLKWGLDSETIAAGFLHDVVENTPTTIEDIKKEFGDNIAFLVDGVTKLGKIKYYGDERQVENLRKMFLAMAEDIRVVLIKLADRIHNIETLEYLPPNKQKRIATETLEIYAPLADRLGMGEIKGELEDKCFPYVYPKEYKKLIDELGNKVNDISDYLDKLKPFILEELKKEGVTPISINTRTKHLYSLWKKLQTQEVKGNINKVYDLAAARIILENIEQCYHALGTIHKIWKPLPGKIKDYIAIPKPNGYQSIHTTVFTNEGKIIEIQIRTAKMHEEAENGIAAHWAYSEQGKPETGGFAKQKNLNWVKQLKEWQNNIGESDDFMQSLKIDFFKDRIFAFTPKGDVINLPDGATPIDFAYSVHTDIGNHCMGAKVNDKMSSLSTQLKNWDVVEILTAKNKKPSQGWLEFAKTANARSKIRVALGIGKKDHLK